MQVKSPRGGKFHTITEPEPETLYIKNATIKPNEILIYIKIK